MSITFDLERVVHDLREEDRRALQTFRSNLAQTVEHYTDQFKDALEAQATEYENANFSGPLQAAVTAMEGELNRGAQQLQKTLDAINESSQEIEKTAADAGTLAGKLQKLNDTLKQDAATLKTAVDALHATARKVGQTVGSTVAKGLRKAIG